MSAPEPLPRLRETLAELTALVEGARAVPMSASCVVNRTEVLGLLTVLQEQLPTALHRAQELLGDAEGVVADGAREAGRLVAQAHEERGRLLADTDIVADAQAEADRVLDQARQDAARLRVDVEEYVDAKLATFEVVLGKTLAAVERGRQKLAGTTEQDALARADAPVG